ncbi:MAG: hypothetical protein DI498_02895 [Paracoccus denitrificans]|nr:MAG: hypothetical protein DI498_02895 [Paracoccus denitrificans]PZO85488.1 MAG: hypothetical protein DI633_02895 [Paracoccus denitrificans]
MALEKNLDLIRSGLGRDAEVLGAQDATPIPELWRNYLDSSDASRMRALTDEMRDMADYFPQAAQRVLDVASDVVVVKTGELGVCRVIVVDLNGKQFLRFSRAPLRYQPEDWNNEVTDLLLTRAPDAIKYLYSEMMNGFTDPYNFVGFKNTAVIRTVEQEIDGFAELESYEKIEALGDQNKVVELLSSGGGGSLLLDLNKDWRSNTDPTGVRVADDDSDADTVPLFATLDAWIAIGLGQEQPS